MRRKDALRMSRRRLPEDMLPRVAIIGRPNVGKSTIFNRVTSKFGGGALVRPGPLNPHLRALRLTGAACRRCSTSRE